MQITSNRFGVMNIQQSDIISMPQGLIGFETSKHWVLLSSPKNPNVAWLHSVTQSHVAVPVVSPRRYDPNYRVHVAKRDLVPLNLRHSDSVYVLCIVSRNNGLLTANLKSPILLNATRQVATQIVVTDAQVLALPIGEIGSAPEAATQTIKQPTRTRQAA